MAKERSGYVYQDKQGNWYARTTVMDSSGKRRNVKRRAKDKTEGAKTRMKHQTARLNKVAEA